MSQQQRVKPIEFVDGTKSAATATGNYSGKLSTARPARAI